MSSCDTNYALSCLQKLPALSGLADEAKKYHRSDVFGDMYLESFQLHDEHDLTEYITATLTQFFDCYDALQRTCVVTTTSKAREHRSNAREPRGSVATYNQWNTFDQYQVKEKQAQKEKQKKGKGKKKKKKK
eukprot:683661_1